jgi:hypothetical protein
MLFPNEALAVLRQAHYDPRARRGFGERACAFFWSDERLTAGRRACSSHDSRTDFYLLAFRGSLVFVPYQEDAERAPLDLHKDVFSRSSERKSLLVTRPAKRNMRAC